MPSGATLLVIYPQDTPNTGRYKINYNFSILAFSSFTGIAASIFTNPNPTTATVGGIPAGSTFPSDHYLQEMMDLLLYPAVTPNFTSFLISAQATSLEVGETVAGLKTFTWTIANTADLQPNSIDIEDTTSSTILASNLADDGSETVFLSSVSKTVPDSNIWTISAQDTDLITFSREYQINWYYAVFYGIDAATTLNAAGIVALAGTSLVSDIEGTYPLAGTGYGYVCVPDTFSTPNGFRDSTTDLPIEMAGTTEGYNFFDGAFYHDSVSVTRNGIPITYRVYRTRDAVSSPTIAVSLTGGTVATLQSVINAGNIANGNAAILGNFSATTFYSGNTPLNTILGNYLAGLTTYVQPGANVTTGGTPLNPIVSVVGSPVFTSMTANSVFATNLSGGTIFSGNTNIGVLFGNLFAPISVTNTYVQEGWNIVTGGTPSRPIVSVYAYPQFSSVTTTSLSAYTLFSNTISGTTFYSGNTPLNTILAQFGTINTTYVQPGDNIATGGTPTNPTVSVIGEPVFTGLTASWINAQNELSGFTIYSAGTNLSHVLEGVTTFVQAGLNVTTGGTKYRPVISLSGSISLTALTATSISGTSISATTFCSGGTDLSHLFGPSTFVQEGLNITTGGTASRPIINVSGSPVFTAVTATSISGTSISATTFYSGNTPLNTILSSLGAGSTTYVQPGLNTTTGGTQNSPIINLAGSIALTAVTASSIFGDAVSAITFYSGSTNLNDYIVWRRVADNLGSIESYNGGFVGADNSLSFGGAIGFGGTWDIALGFGATIFDGSNNSIVIGGDSNQIGQLNGWTSIIGGLANSTQDTVLNSTILGGEGSSIQQDASYCSILNSFGSTVRRSSLYSSIVGGSINTILSGISRSVIVGGQNITATTSDTVYVPKLNIGTTVYSSSTDLMIIQANGDVHRQTIADTISGLTTYVQQGLNITTGGTPNSPVISVSGSPVFTAVTATSISGTSISATTFYSGNTSLNDILSSLGAGSTTYVQPGLNITTGGTATSPIINTVGSPIFTGVTATSISGTSISATTFFSGSTDIGFLIASSLGGNTYDDSGLLAKFNIQGQLRCSVDGSTTPALWATSTGTGFAGYFNGSNAGELVFIQQNSTGVGLLSQSSGGYGAQIISIEATPLYVNANGLLGDRPDIARFYTGLTPSLQFSILYDGALYWSSATGAQRTRTFLGVPHVQPGLNITTGGTSVAPTVNLAGSISLTAVTASSISGTSVSATTFYSGNTNLNHLLGGGSTTYVQPGLNITTGGTDNAPVINVSGSPVFTAVTSIVLSATTISADTIHYTTSLIDASSANFQNGVYFRNSSNVFVNSNRFTYDASLHLLSLSSSIPTAGLYVQSGGITGATFLSSGLIRAQSLSGITSSATTFSSGSTPMDTILAGIQTFVQDGTNITTGGTLYRPTINLSSNPSVTTFVASGNLSGGTIFEGGTSLTDKYSPKTLTFRLSADTYILALTDHNRVVDMSGASAQNVVVPRNSAVAFAIGTQLIVHQSGAGQVTFSADTGVSINNYSSQNKLIGQYASASLIKKDTNQWILMGNTTT